MRGHETSQAGTGRPTLVPDDLPVLVLVYWECDLASVEINS